MSYRDITQCDRSLNFRPVKPWSNHLPAMSWKGHLLVAFDRTNGPSIDLCEMGTGNFIGVFNDLHPELSLPELGRIFRSWNSSQLMTMSDGFNWDEFFSSYGLRLTDGLKDTLFRLNQTPMGFQNWVSQKGLGANDLQILKAVDDIEDLKPLLQLFEKATISKNVGCQCLEWAIEIYLLNSSWEKVLPESANELTQFEIWAKKLKRLRYPLASSFEESFQSKVSKIPWPRNTKAAWFRKGDESGLEVKFFAKDQLELKNKLKALLGIEKKLDENPSQLWTN